MHGACSSRLNIELSDKRVKGTELRFITACRQCVMISNCYNFQFVASTPGYIKPGLSLRPWCKVPSVFVYFYHYGIFIGLVLIENHVTFRPV